MRALYHGDVVELVDTLALGASAERYVGSSPIIPTIMKAPEIALADARAKNTQTVQNVAAFQSFPM